MFEVLRAEAMGMCFGVRDALGLAREHAVVPGRLTLLGELVHNPEVSRELQVRGVEVTSDLPSVTTPAVMITAHGVSDRRRWELEVSGRQVLDATCPLVLFAHRMVKRLAREGWFPVIVGQEGHVEVRGLVEDLEDSRVVLTREDVDRLPQRDRFGFVSQTTQPLDRCLELVEHCRRRFPLAQVKWVDTVCQPTKQRQTAALSLASRCDVVVVVGGRNSNNTRELVASCRRHCARVHHVTAAGEVEDGWFEGARRVGLTAGTSTLDATVDAVEARLRQIAMLRAG